MKFGINTFTLKIIAITAMVIDHIGVVLLPQNSVLCIIGRISFPIYAYLLVEGFFHTHNVKKYMMRMGILAIISEIPFDLAFAGVPLEFEKQNVFFTLFLGLVMLYLIQRTPNISVMFVGVAIMLLLSEIVMVDYGYAGLLMILCYYFCREQKLLKIIGLVVINVILMGDLQAYAILALIPIAFHNGKEGPKMKWFFYGFYPIHLFVIYVISMIL